MIRRLFSYPFFLHYPASNQQDHHFVSCDQSDNDLHITDDPRRLAYAFNLGQVLYLQSKIVLS